MQNFGQSLIIEGQPCKIVHKKRDLLRKGRYLYINQCEDLVNHYIGFNGWRSQIVYHQKEAETSEEITFATAVKLTFGNVSVEGVGMSKVAYAGPEEKLQKMAMVQKSSKTEAMVHAFAKIVLVLVFNLNDPVKATIRINHQVKDPFFYNSTWGDRPVIENVNELEEEPPFED